MPQKPRARLTLGTSPILSVCTCKMGASLAWVPRVLWSQQDWASETRVRPHPHPNSQRLPGAPRIKANIFSTAWPLRPEALTLPISPVTFYTPPNSFPATTRPSLR